MLSEIGQTEKNKYYVILLYMKKKWMNKSKEKQLIDTTQSKLVVARGEGYGEGN